MAYPPGQTFNFRNNGIGLAQNPGALPLVIGYASGLTANQLYQSSNPNTFRDLAVSGPVMETALAAIAKAGGVLVLALAASTAAVTSAVTAERVDSSTGDVTVSGTPTLDFDAKVEITKTGAKGVGRFRYTLDDETYASERVIPLGGTFAVPGSGLTLTFDGTPTNGAVTQTGSGPVVTVTGTPLGEYDFVIEITTGGAVATAIFRWSSNGGSTWTTGVTTAATVLLGATGVTANFAAGTYVVASTYAWTSGTSADADFEVGDVHSFTTTAPHYTTSNLAAGMAVLKAQLGKRRIRKVILTGENASAAAGATMYAAMASHMATLEAEHQFGRAILDDGGSTADEVRAAYAAAASDRVAYGGFKRARCIVRAAFDGYGNAWMPGVRSAAERIFEADMSENLGRVASGPMEWVTDIEHDEGADQQFVESDKIITFRTHDGEDGFFITNGYIKSPTGSDFLYWDWGIVVDELAEAMLFGQNKFLLSKLRSLVDGTGRLDPNEAVRLEGAIKGLIDARLLAPTNIEGRKGHVAATAYKIDLTNDFLATRTIMSSGAAVSLSPIETFEGEVGLTRSINTEVGLTGSI